MSDYLGIALLVLAAAVLLAVEGYSSSECIKAGGNWHDSGCSAYCERAKELRK